MLPSVSAFFERLADRCLALAAGLLASSIESASIRRDAEQQSQLEDLARSYEADGQTEVAATIRSRAQQLSHSNPAAQGESILSLGNLSDTSAISSARSDSSQNPTDLSPLGLPSPGRRGSGRSKKVSTAEPLSPLSDLLAAPGPASADVDAAPPATEVAQ